MTDDWIMGEVLKEVFPLLDGPDLASCMLVSRQWRDVAKDDYFWKCLCAKRWPSVCKNKPTSAMSYRSFFQTFSKCRPRQSLPPPKLSFKDLVFYIDIWSDRRLIFSEPVPGPVLRAGIADPPLGISESMKLYLLGPNYKMMMPVEPQFIVPREEPLSVSVLVGRRDSGKVACVVGKALFDYVDWSTFRALAYEFLNLSPNYPFVSGVRAWISLLFMAGAGQDTAQVFGLEIDFCDAATSEREVLWLLDMLDWK
ncbi:F-box family protein [Wolffia australiana]